MKKRNIFIVTAMSCLISLFPSGVYAESDLNLKINGEIVNLDNPLILDDDRILVPVKGIFERLGAEAKYDLDENVVYIEDKYTLIELSLDKSTALVHRKYDFTGIPQKVEIDVNPRTVGDTVYVPLRFVAEGLSADVQWDGENNTANISKELDSNKVDYDCITLEDLKEDNSLIQWFEDNRTVKGIHYIKENDSTYVLLSAGEKSTGGYSIRITGVIAPKPDEVSIYACIESPANESMVTQAITYPTLLLKIDNPNIKHVGGSIY